MLNHNVRYLLQDGDSGVLEGHLLEVQQKYRRKRDTNPTASVTTAVQIILLAPDGSRQDEVLLSSGYRVVARSAREIGVVGEADEGTVWMTFDLGNGRPRLTAFKRSSAHEARRRNGAARRGTLSGRVTRHAMHA